MKKVIISICIMVSLMGGFCKCKCIRRSGNEEVNYLASYRFMIKIGNEYGKGKHIHMYRKQIFPG